MSQALFSMEEENLFSMSVPKCISDKDKNIPQDILLSPNLHKTCKNDLQQLNNNATQEEWLFSLDEPLSFEYNIRNNNNNNNNSIINSNEANEMNCHNYYNMTQQNYQLWLASF